MQATTPSKVRGVLKWIGVATAFGSALYIAVYFWVSHSEAFAYAEKAIRSSPLIAERVGAIEQVCLDPRGPFDEYYVDSDATASMVVDVTGDKGKVEIQVGLRKTRAVWEVTGATVQGLPIPL